MRAAGDQGSVVAKRPAIRRTVPPRRFLEMATTAPPPSGFEEIQRDVLSRLFGRMVWIRLIFIPLALGLILFVAFTDASRWRVRAIGGLLILGGAFFVSEALRYRRRGFRPGAVEMNLGAMVATQLVLMAATGALSSPFGYAMAPVSVLVGLFAAQRAVFPLAGLQLAGVWGLFALEFSGSVADLNPSVFGGGAQGSSEGRLIASAAVLTAVPLIGSQAGRAIRQAFDGMLRRAVEAQHESLRIHGEQARELTALSAEIAHELKNPLASVKGLAGLLEAAVPEGKPRERLAVLRREADRMQGILDEFLNFSRPLVPLSLSRVDVGELALEVAALYEGVARPREIELVVRGEGEGAAVVQCDRRKAKQVLINLVQNALEASRPGGEVEVEIVCEESAAGSGAMVRVRVLDRGAGVPEVVTRALFVPGTTTKPRGSGLGLTIARALARQHGGEVELWPRPGGGSVATFSLPVEVVASVESKSEVAPSTTREAAR